MDRISEILQTQLKAAQLTLALLNEGYRIDLPGDDAKLIPSTKEDAAFRVAELEGAIRRHEERNRK